MKLDDPVEVIPRTHSVTIRRFRRLGIETIFDFLNYFPFRYENYSLISPIARLQESEIVTIKGTIVSSQNLYLRKGLVIQKAVVADESGKLEVSWYNQPYLLRHFVKGGLIAVAGLAKKFSGQIKLEAKEYDLLPSLESSTVHTGRLIPVYSEKNGLSTKIIREKMFRVLSSLPPLEDPLAAFLSSRKNLVEENKAYREVHFPTTAAELEQARKRLSFDELFFLELSQALVRREWEKTQLRRPFLYQDREKKKLDSFMAGLPFQLTFAQKQAVAEILSDLVLPRPMNRFLQGDVGSGKTVVAAVACYLAHLNGLQSLVMAPTEILALQHFQTLEKLFAKTKLRVALQTGSRKVAKKIIDEPIVVGTHALLEKKVKFRKVGLVVVDEQHRFGVMQRAILKKKGEAAHFLTMTATPIPRTVALILYGQLNLSVLDEMPKGRRPVKTYMVPEQKKKDCYRWICGKIKKDGEQAFIICPLIEESETETMKSLKAAVKEFAYLKTQVFPDCRVGLLHGKMKSTEKEEMMRQFTAKTIDILVSTSVVEVGIDIPNATMMIIEGAERFGLAQLHQLRGRVGRSGQQSYTFLFTSNAESKSRDRLSFFTRTTSGLRLAEYDLKIRGAGEVYGTRQHGYLDLKIADLTDYKMIREAGAAVREFLGRYKEAEFTSMVRSRLSFSKEASKVGRD